MIVRNITTMPFFMKLLAMYGMFAPSLAIVSIFDAYSAEGWSWGAIFVFISFGIVPALIFFAGAMCMVLKKRFSRPLYISGMFLTSSVAGIHPGVIPSDEWVTLVAFNAVIVLALGLYLWFNSKALQYFHEK